MPISASEPAELARSVLALRWLGLAALGLVTTGCFAGYDSRWGQQKKAQQHFASAETPKSLEAQPGAGSGSKLGNRGKLRTLRLRLLATPTYAAQVVDWRRRFDDTLSTVNAVFEPTFGATLEIETATGWDPAGGEESVEQLMDALRASDAGDDVDWVVGLAGSLPRFEESFHELGIGEVVGKHIVLRAINSAAEYEALENGLSELSEADRTRFRRARLSHKTSTVFLHELGHTLGALHEADRTNVMNPRYSKDSQHLSPPAVDIMRLVLAHRTRDGHIDSASKPELVERWQRDAARWTALQLESALRSVGASRAPANTPTNAASPFAAASATPATAVSRPTPALPVAGLTPKDQGTFAQARERLTRGDAAGALGLAEPLFTLYPSVPEVQELRCQIALKRGLSWIQARAECGGMMPAFH